MAPDMPYNYFASRCMPQLSLFAVKQSAISAIFRA